MSLLPLTSLPETFPHFDSSENLLSHLSPALRRELVSLSREPDPALRDEGMLSLARRLEARGRPDLAAPLFVSLAEASGPVQERARAEWEVLQGRGEFGHRAEHWLRDFAVQVTDPATLVAMGTAGAVFRAVRIAAFARLQAGPWQGALARWGAATAGLGAEAPAFTLTARGVSELLGSPLDWSGEALGRDLAASYLTLASLRGAGALSRRMLRGLKTGPQNLPTLHLVLGQGGLLSGVLLAHSLEETAGLRPESHGGEALFAGLATLLHFQVAGRLSRAAFGKNFAAWERRLDFQTEALRRPAPQSRGSGAPTLAPVFAGWPAPPVSRSRETPVDFQIVRMSGNRDGGGPRASDSGTRPALLFPAPEFPAASAFLQGVGHPEAGLRAFLNTLPVPATVARLEGSEGELRVVAANTAFLQLFGHSERELARRPLTEFLSVRSQPISASRIWTMIRGGVFKATPMEFEASSQPQKIWVSGLVRTVYDQNFAFTFYSPRTAAEVEPPSVPDPLKALQLADGTRRLDLDAEGYFELRSSLELALQTSNPGSPLIRELAQRDLRLRITDNETAPISALGPTLVGGLAQLERQVSFPPGRSLFVEQAGRRAAQEGTLHLKRGAFDFALSSERAPSVSPPAENTVRFPLDRASPIPTRLQPGSLVDRVRRTLEGIITPKTEGEGSDPTKPGRK